MHKTLHLLAAAALAGVVGLACSEGVAPSTDQTEVLAAEREQLGGMVDSAFGTEGAAPTAAPLLAAAVAAPDTAPSFWGRIRVVPGGPLPVFHRDVTIVSDTATVEHDITFTGVFLVDTSADGIFNPTAKPLHDRMTQHAVLVRDPALRHGWRVVELSPQDWTVVDPAKQTVAVQEIKVSRNDTLLIDVTDRAALYDVDQHIPRFHVGDTIQVWARVANTTNSGFTPATFVFLHVHHWDPMVTSWRRVEMQDNGDGTYQRTWIAGRTGRDRFVVDALDAATLLLGSGDNYRTNEVGIPYRIE